MKRYVAIILVSIYINVCCVSSVSGLAPGSALMGGIPITDSNGSLTLYGQYMGLSESDLLAVDSSSSIVKSSYVRFLNQLVLGLRSPLDAFSVVDFLGPFFHSQFNAMVTPLNLSPSVVLPGTKFSSGLSSSVVVPPVDLLLRLHGIQRYQFDLSSDRKVLTSVLSGLGGIISSRIVMNREDTIFIINKIFDLMRSAEWGSAMYLKIFGKNLFVRLFIEGGLSLADKESIIGRLVLLRGSSQQDSVWEILVRIICSGSLEDKQLIMQFFPDFLGRLFEYCKHNLRLFLQVINSGVLSDEELKGQVVLFLKQRLVSFLSEDLTTSFEEDVFLQILSSGVLSDEELKEQVELVDRWLVKLLFLDFDRIRHTHVAILGQLISVTSLRSTFLIDNFGNLFFGLLSSKDEGMRSMSISVLCKFIHSRLWDQGVVVDRLLVELESSNVIAKQSALVMLGVILSQGVLAVDLQEDLFSRLLTFVDDEDSSVQSFAWIGLREIVRSVKVEDTEKKRVILEKVRDVLVQKASPNRLFDAVLYAQVYVVRELVLSKCLSIEEREDFIKLLLNLLQVPPLAQGRFDRLIRSCIYEVFVDMLKRKMFQDVDLVVRVVIALLHALPSAGDGDVAARGMCYGLLGWNVGEKNIEVFISQMLLFLNRVNRSDIKIRLVRVLGIVLSRSELFSIVVQKVVLALLEILSGDVLSIVVGEEVVNTLVRIASSHDIIQLLFKALVVDPQTQTDHLKNVNVDRVLSESLPYSEVLENKFVFLLPFERYGAVELKEGQEELVQVYVDDEGRIRLSFAGDIGNHKALAHLGVFHVFLSEKFQKEVSRGHYRMLKSAVPDIFDYRVMSYIWANTSLRLLSEFRGVLQHKMHLSLQEARCLDILEFVIDHYDELQEKVGVRDMKVDFQWEQLQVIFDFVTEQEIFDYCKMARSA